MKVTLLYFDGCPNWVETDQHLTQLQAESPDLQTGRQRVETAEDAERLGFRGSPSILIDGVDPFADYDAPVGLSCRIYATPSGPAGSPTHRRHSTSPVCQLETGPLLALAGPPWPYGEDENATELLASKADSEIGSDVF